MGDAMQLVLGAAAAGLAGGVALGDVSYGGLTSLEVAACLLFIAAACAARILSTGLPKASKPLPVPAGAAELDMSVDNRTNFLRVFKEITADVLSDIDRYDLPASAAPYLKRLMEYNVPLGKLNRGLTVVEAMRSIKGKMSKEDFYRACVLGWCVEWLQAFFLVADDMMDASETRRGQPCWYKVDGVGLNAINDGILLEAHIYVILKKYFGDTELYVPLMDLFHEVTHQTSLGQFLDITTADPAKVDFSRFSMQVGPSPVVP